MTAPPSPPPGPSADARDLQVAAWLAVDPLDEVTRARLVRTALAGVTDAPGATATPTGSAPGAPRHRARRVAALAAAAAVAVGLVVGVGVVARDGADDTPTAADAPSPKAAPDRSRRAGDVETGLAAPEAADAAPPVVVASIGDLGDVSSQRALERAARAVLSAPFGSPTARLDGCALTAGRSFGTPVAAGRGRIDGVRATVVVAEQPAGSTAVVAVAGRDCDRAVSVILP